MSATGFPGTASSAGATSAAPEAAQPLHNIYQAPVSSFQSFDFAYAGFWRRVAAYIIDSILLAMIGGVVGLFVGIIVGVVLGTSGAETETIEAVSQGLGVVVGMILNWLYFTLCESSSRQATVGKMALSIVVTDLNGQRISWGKANGRYWSKIISGLMLAIGFMMAGFTEKKQGMHDIIAGTLVVVK